MNFGMTKQTTPYPSPFQERGSSSPHTGRRLISNRRSISKILLLIFSLLSFCLSFSLMNRSAPWVSSAAAALMQRGGVRWVIVGADRIAANGDVANKIGTYGLAVAARRHRVRFMVVAPTSTVDLAVLDGASIPIEQRAAEELLTFGGQPVAASGVKVWNPSFDVTPADLVDALVTERGVVWEPDTAKIATMMGR